MSENINQHVPVALSPVEKKQFRTDIKAYIDRGYTMPAAGAQVKKDWIDRGACRPDMYSQYELLQGVEDPPAEPVKVGRQRIPPIDIRMRDEIEKMKDSKITCADDYRPMIAAAIQHYNDKMGLPDDYWRTKGKPQEWRGCLRYIGNNVFRACPPIVYNAHVEYEIKQQLLYDVIDLYGELCESVGLPAKRGDFTLFFGGDVLEMANWGSSLNPVLRIASQKLEKLEADAVSAAAEGNRINPVIGLARLNAFHGWTRKSEIKQAVEVQAVSVGELPRFDS